MNVLHQRSRARMTRQIIIDLAVLVAIGVVLAFLAPLGTGFMTLPGRIAYWVLLALAGYLFYKPIGAIVLRLGPKLDLPNWFLWTASVVIASVPMAVLVWFVNAGAGPVRIPPLDIALTHYFSVAVVGAVVTVMFNLLPVTQDNPPVVDNPAAMDPAQQTSGLPSNASSGQARFLDRLPPALGSELIALEMEDHYVRAHTMLGSELVLMRMRDAVDEVDTINGEQVHRSWWVARDAVEDVRREGRNVRLILARGVEAPVSRANITRLKETGWF